MPTPSPTSWASAPSAPSFCANRSSVARLRRQSYELNDEGLFNVEYADVLGIPFDFAAKPIVSPPKPNRRANRPRPCGETRSDALEITFPRVEGYRVELPDERLEAEFRPRPCAGTDAGTARPLHTTNQGIIGEGVDLTLEHLEDMRSSTILFQPGAAPDLYASTATRARSPSFTSLAR